VPLPTTLPEADARRVLLLRAHEAERDNPRWTEDDRRWATRAAADDPAARTGPAAWLAARARHALQRLAPRDAAAQRLLQRPVWPAWPLPAALGAAFGAGVALDSLGRVGGAPGIDLLSLPWLGLLAWNLAVLLLWLWGLRGGAGPGRPWPARLLQRLAGSRVVRLGQRWLDGPGGGAGAGGGPVWRRFAADWAMAAAPALQARALMLAHGAAAALALGMVAGLYLRGLVLDLRAAWQSTFLGPEAVHTVLATLLAPAAALTGLAVPDVATVASLRITPGQPVPTGGVPAAVWVHLWAATLVLWVVLPRAALAVVAGAQARRCAAAVALPLDAPDLRRLLLARGAGAPGGAATVRAWPQTAAQAARHPRLGALLEAALGPGTRLVMQPPLAYGVPVRADEPEPGRWELLLVDLATTPEAEVHGQALRALAAAGTPVLLLADEAAFAQRFAHLPQRLAQRRAVWRRLAVDHGAAFAALPLDEDAPLPPDAAARLADAMLGV
jgi:hypothetical protein